MLKGLTYAADSLARSVTLTRSRYLNLFGLILTPDTVRYLPHAFSIAGTLSDVSAFQILAIYYLWLHFDFVPD